MTRLILAAAAVVVLGMGGCAALIAAVISGSANSTQLVHDDLMYQCDSMMGPNPSTTSTGTSRSISPTAATTHNTAASVVQAPATSSISESTEAYPSTNPYASFAAEDTSGLPSRLQQCLHRLPTVSYQGPPVTTRNVTASSMRAAELANTLVTDQILSDPVAGSLNGPVGHKISQTWAVRWIMFTVAQLALPADLDNMMTAGVRVDPASTSPGDLVFSDFTGSGPQRVLIALTQSLATSVPTEPNKPATLVTIPNQQQIVVKRVLDMATEEGHP